MTDKTEQHSNGQMWVEHEGSGPLFATAIHSGHEIRRELLPLLTIDESTRAREEDPYTDSWVKIVPSWIAVKRSRFEVDLNRPPDEAVRTDPSVWDGCLGVNGGKQRTKPRESNTNPCQTGYPNSHPRNENTQGLCSRVRTRMHLSPQYVPFE